MHTPIMILTGEAGSGKDTIAGFLVKASGGVAIAQADPMKRLAQTVFGFSDDQLWGPSKSRNAIDTRYPAYVAGVSESCTPWYQARCGIDREGWGWLKEMFPDASPKKLGLIFNKLSQWFEDHVKGSCYYGGKPVTPRLVLQTLGTEFGRNIDPAMWSKHALRVAEKLLGGGFRYDRSKGLIEDVSYIGAPLVVITDGRFRNEIVRVLKINGITVKITDPAKEANDAAAKAGIVGHQSEAEQKTIPLHFFDFHIVNDKDLGLDPCEKSARDLWIACRRAHISRVP